MPITHLEVRRHPVWRDEMSAATHASPSRRVLVLGHSRSVSAGVAVLIVAALTALALLAR